MQLKLFMRTELKLGQMRSFCRSVCSELVWVWDLDLWLGRKWSPDLLSQSGV